MIFYIIKIQFMFLTIENFLRKISAFEIRDLLILSQIKKKHFLLMYVLSIQIFTILNQSIIYASDTNG